MSRKRFVSSLNRKTLVATFTIYRVIRCNLSHNEIVLLMLIFLTFLMFICTESIAADRILPIPRPLIDKETKTTLTEKKKI